ncbi:hypothetical protein V6N11_079655 [Hibiscus sabdariffa]|uniref:Uncharacterized protein n=1 Tax=Hibiscus sabdariffa TaxID=183260 RepID=A0ABR2RW50_9ROSI
MEIIAVGAAANIVSEAVKGIYQDVKCHVRYIIFYQETVDKFDEKLKTLVAKRTGVEQDVDVAKKDGEKIKAEVLDWCSRVDKAISEEEKKVKDLEVKAKNKCFIGLCPNIKSLYKLSKKAEEDAATFDELIKECQFERVGYRDVPEAIAHAEFETSRSRKKVFDDIMVSLRDSSMSMIGAMLSGKRIDPARRKKIGMQFTTSIKRKIPMGVGFQIEL